MFSKSFNVGAAYRIIEKHFQFPMEPGRMRYIPTHPQILAADILNDRRKGASQGAQDEDRRKDAVGRFGIYGCPAGGRLDEFFKDKGIQDPPIPSDQVRRQGPPNQSGLRRIVVVKARRLPLGRLRMALQEPQ